MATPIAGGYHTLGWNHPGFAASTGAPFPAAERQAADAVMQFAIHRLGFQGWKLMSFSHGQESERASLLLIGSTSVNNQSEARSAS